LKNEDFHKKYECLSCFEDFTFDEMTVLGCRHFFCNECYFNYLKFQITEGGLIEELTCPAYKCKFPVDSITIASLLTPDLYSKYIFFMMKAFVDKQSNTKWCPGKRCENVVICNSKNAMVHCLCGTIFCFNCLQEGHWPATCDQIKWYNDSFIRKNFNDPDINQKTLEWVQKYTKDCKKCNSPIEKNGGCNHMRCSKCSYQFCWVCLGEWTGGTHYSCGVRQTQSVDERQLNLRISESTVNLTFNQLLDLHEKWKIHDDSRITSVGVERMKGYMLRKDGNLEGCEIICRALEHIFLCRHIILNICIMGMWRNALLKGKGKELKSCINDLQSNINLLSSVIDVPLKNLDIKAIERFTQSVSNGIRKLQNRLK